MRSLTRRWALATRGSAAAAAAAAVAAAALLTAAPTRIAAAVAPAPSPADDGFAVGGAFVADLPLPVAACGACAFYVDERWDGSMGLRREDASEAGALAKQQVGPAASDKKKNKKDNKKDDLPCGGGCNNLKLDWLGIEILGDALAGVPVKKKLSLKGNALTRLDAQELRGLSELKVLELDKNELQVRPTERRALNSHLSILRSVLARGLFYGALTRRVRTTLACASMCATTGPAARGRAGRARVAGGAHRRKKRRALLLRG